MKCFLVIATLFCVVAGQQQSLPLLTRLLRPTSVPTSRQLDPNEEIFLSPPSPAQQPEFSPSPQFLLPISPKQRSLPSSSSAVLSSKNPTSSPFHSSPTTIKFTLDDASAFFQPQLSAQVSKKQDSLTRFLLESPAAEVVEVEADSTGSASEDEYLWIVTSPEEDTLTADAKQLSDGKEEGETSDKWISDTLEPADGIFKPSLSFPFLTEARRPATKARLADENLVAAASNLQSQPLHFAEPDYNLFALNPLKIEDSKNKVSLQEVKNDRPLSKTPVPRVVDFSDEKENSVEESTSEAPSGRRTLHFNEEFLTLIKSHNPKEKETNESVTVSSNGNLLWLSEGLLDKAGHTGSHETDLPGAFFSTFKPSRTLKTELPVTLFSTLKTSKAPKTELTGAFLSTFKPSQAPKSDPPTFKQPQPSKTTNNIGGVFTTSLRGLTSTTASNVQEPTEKLSQGLKVTLVGEVGEVPHEDEVSEAALVTPLSAAFRHGVQSLNVSAWVSGCPKLYGKVVLNCAVQHDAQTKAALTMRWKKKTFSEGRVEEAVLSEANVITQQDPRLSLERRGEHYNLAIKNFRAEDCGSYECEGRAADTVAASQLLLFMCH